MLYLQSVLVFEFFQYYVDALYCENCTFLTDKDRSCNSQRLDMFVTVLNMFLQFFVKAYGSLLTCLTFCYGKFWNIKYLFPPQGKNIRYPQSCKTADCYKKRNLVVPIFCQFAYQVHGFWPLEVVSRCIAVFQTHNNVLLYVFYKESEHYSDSRFSKFLIIRTTFTFSISEYNQR